MGIGSLSHNVAASVVGYEASGSVLGGWTPYKSGAASLVGTLGILIGGPGRLRGIGACNTSAATKYYLVVCDTAGAPVANDPAVGAVPLDTTANWPGSSNTLDFGPEGFVFTLGIAYAISTTPHKVTLAASADCFVWGFYKVG